MFQWRTRLADIWRKYSTYGSRSPLTTARWTGAYLLLVVLSGCATIGGGVPSGEAKAKAAEACTIPADSGSIQVGVCVLPRLGLFSELGWQSRAHFLESLILPGDKSVDLKARLPDEWDWITTIERPAPRDCIDYWGRPKPASANPTIPGGCDQAPTYERWRQKRAEAQLEIRRVKVGVVGPGVASQGCNFSIDTLNGSYPCNTVVTLRFPRDSEKARAITIMVDIDGQARRLKAVLPRDELIVALGDSYLSGEGNPDRQILNSENVDTPNRSVDSVAWWQDRRCHRSLWAWPSRFALERAGTDQWKKSAKSQGDGGGIEYHVAVNHGVTLVSAGCSGAEIYDGLISRYRGRESLDDLKAVWSRIDTDSPFGLAIPLLQDDKKAIETYQGRRLRTQVEQVSDFTGGRDIDLALLSVGGNDVEFAGLIQQFMFKGQRTSTGSDADDKILADILALGPDYDQLANELRREVRLSRLQGTLITQYPDPTYIAAGKPCDSSLVFWLFGINAVESKYISDSVVGRLNDAVRDAGKRNAWSVVQVNEGAPFSSHGWCADYDGSAYGASARWFRKYEDANQVQGPLPGLLVPVPSGIMHPTHAAHHKLAKLVTEHVSKGRVSFHFPGVAFDADTLQGPDDVASVGKVLEVRAERASGCDEVKDCVAAGYEYRIEPADWRECSTDPCSVSELPNGGTILKIALEQALQSAGSDSTKPFSIRMRGRGTNNLRVASETARYRADFDGPIIVVDAADWSSAPQRNLHLRAIDTESGIKEWRFSGAELASACQEQIVGTGPNQASVCTLAVGEEGGHIVAYAIDKVGNETAMQLSTLIDRTPPTLDAIWMHGHRHTAGEPVLLLWRKGPLLQVGLEVRDALAGVSRVSLDGVEGMPDNRGTYFFDIDPTEGEANAGVVLRQFAMQDLAGNKASGYIANTMLHQLPRKQNPKGSTWWRTRIARGESAELLTKAKQLRGITTGESDAAEAQLLVGWLNLLDGRIKPDKKLEGGVKCLDGTRINAHIKIANWRPVSFYSFLRTAGREQTPETRTWLACLAGT